jgi:hypothetical protein
MAPQLTTLVILEAGAEAPRSVGRVVAQAEGETMQRFVARVRATVAAAPEVHRVTLVAGKQHDFARIAARAEIARAAASTVASGGGGSLVLAASDLKGELAQRALAEILDEQIGGSVRVTAPAFDGDTSVAA